MTPEKCQSELNDVLRNNPTITFLLDKIESSGCAIDRSKFFKIEKCSKQVCGGFVPEKGVSVCHNHIQTRTEMENLLAHELIHAYDDCTRRKMDWMDVRHHACSEVRAANLSGDCHWCVRCCWCCCCYAFARTRSFWRIVFLLSTRLLLSFERRLIITLSSSFLCVRVCVRVCVINNIIVIHRVNEFFRGNLQLKGQHKTCAKRRAELSVAMSPVCEKREKDGIESKEECARNAVEKVLDRCFGDTKPFDDIP